MERPHPNLGTQTRTTGDRIVAIVADTIIVLVASIVISQLIGGVSMLWSYVLLTFGYHVSFEATYGQTIGKRGVNVVVVREDGEPCNWTAAVIRNVVRLVDSILFYLVGIAFILGTEDNQRLGDLLAGTVVAETGEAPPPDSNGQKDDDEASFKITVHHDVGGVDRYIELVNESIDPIELSRGRLRSETGSEFRFPQNVPTLGPDASMTFLLPHDFGMDPGSPLTLETRAGETHAVAWAGA